MDDPRPLVSVIVACYNQSRWVVESLDSVRAQTYPDVQLLVIDDASTDTSAPVIRRWMAETGTPCELVVHEKNQGICSTFNDGLGRARGTYVAFLASDDVWFTEKLERQVALFERCGEDVGVVYSDALRMDETGSLMAGTFITSEQRWLRYIPDGEVFDVLVDGNFLPAPSALVRRSCFDRVGAYDESLCYEDWDMWLRIAAHYRFAFSDYTSCKYRTVATSMTRRLLNAESFPALMAHFAIARKWLDSPRVTPTLRTVFIGHMRTAAERMYKHRYRDWRTCVDQTCQIAPSTRMHVMRAMSQAGLPYRAFRGLDLLRSAAMRVARVGRRERS